MMIKYLIILFLNAFLFQISIAQELNARVELNAPTVQNINTRSVELLEKLIQDFLNSQSWTTNQVRSQERIDCSFLITIREFDGASGFKADAQILSSRPIFGTNYNSPILSFRDKYFNFTYTEGEQLNFNDSRNLSSLVSLLGYYANVIIGLDMDTFKLYGGNSCFSVARNIVNYSQNGQNEGWGAMDAMDNRYWLINNIMDSKYVAYRDFSYNYHLNGLDKMSDNEIEAKKNMVGYLPKLKTVNRYNTGNILTPSLYSAKSNEFVGIFSKLPGNESMKVYNELIELDPSNAAKYEALKL